MALDCSELESIRITRHACLAMIASACEVYPRECIGTVCCTRIPKKTGKIIAALPFQKADRTPSSVMSLSGYFFDQLFLAGPWKVMGSYHSHPQTKSRDDTTCLPSRADLETLEEGDLEIITRIGRHRTHSRNVWTNNASGRISISWGRFQFLIGAYVKGKNEGKYLWYRPVDIEFVT